MPRLPKVRSRTPRAGATEQPAQLSPAPPATRGATPRRAPDSQRIFHQCVACGAAPIEPMYGVDDSSWCPHCGRDGCIFSCTGQLPDPPLYGQWRRDQQAKASPHGAAPPAASAPATDAAANSAIPSFLPQQESLSMMHKKLHTGLYCCPECCVEYDLIAQERLKCKDCGRALLSGSLDDFEDAEEEGSGEG